MAIDDNTSYELTGYQVKDLASKIRAKADSNSLASVATSGLYSDLTGAPTIPTVYNGTLTIQQNGTQLGTFSANQSSDTTINITGGGGATYTAGNGINIDANNEISIDDTVVAEVSDLPTDFTGATTSVAGTSGLVPAPTTSDPDKFLKGDGTWGTPAAPETTVVYTLAGLTDGNYANGLLKDSNDTRVIAYDIYTHIRNGDTVRLVYGLEEAYTVTSIYTNSDDDLFVEFDSPIQKKKFYRALIMAGNHSSSPDVLQSSTTEYSVFTGATSSVAGSTGLVPQPAAGDQGKVLHGDGTWKDATAKLVEMSYGEANSWAKFIAAYNAGSIVYCRASSNANPASGSQTRKAFMAYVNNATTPTSVEFQYVRSVSSKTEAQPVDQVFVYTLTNTNGGTWSVASRNMAPKIAAGNGINVSYSNGTYTISLA